MNKKLLYENIMKSISKEVKKLINENVQQKDVVLYDNYNFDYEDYNEDYETELKERPEEETKNLFYNFVRSHYLVILCDYLDYDSDVTTIEDISDEDIDSFFEDDQDIKDEYFEKFKKVDKINFANNLDEFNWNEMAKEMKKVYGDFVLFGSKERWTGVNSGLDVEEDCTLYDVILKHCTNCELFKITELANGGINVRCSHHDGTNEFEIHLLNNYGSDMLAKLEDAASTKEEQYCIEELKNENSWENIDIEC